MRYPPVEYLPVGTDAYRELHIYDGTCRGVVFRDEAAALESMRPGRAELDAAAIEKGFLPVGATLVSPAGVSERAISHAEGACPGDPLARIRARFSATLLVARSEWIDVDRSLRARSTRPLEYERYVRSAGGTRDLG